MVADLEMGGEGRILAEISPMSVFPACYRSMQMETMARSVAELELEMYQ